MNRSNLQAPLIATETMPIPQGGEARWFRGMGGARLRAAWFPATGARGSVVLSGGRTEPIEKYFEVIDELRQRGLSVLAHDWRGQGLSHRLLPDRLRGHATSFHELVFDFDRLVELYQDRMPQPWFAVGHSMGGCVTLLSMAQQRRPRFAGCVLSAPMLGLRTDPVPLGLARPLATFHRLVGLSDRYVFGQAGNPFDEPFEDNVLTHDPSRYQRYREQIAVCPELALGAPTWGWLDAALRATLLVSDPYRLRRITVPVIICAAGDDRRVHSEDLRRAAANLPDGRLVEIPGAYHEILMETDELRRPFWQAFDQLLASYSW